MIEKYTEWTPYASSEALLKKVEHVLYSMMKNAPEGGVAPTIRQLFYRLVDSEEIANTTADFSRVRNLVANARMGGLLDWDLVDPAVFPPRPVSWLETRFRPKSLEIWVDKASLLPLVVGAAPEGVKVVDSSRVRTLSEMRIAAEEIKFTEDILDHAVTIVHISDHTKTGLEARRALEAWLARFGVDTSRIREALTPDSIEWLGLPEAPASKRAEALEAPASPLDSTRGYELESIHPAELHSWIRELGE